MNFESNSGYRVGEHQRSMYLFLGMHLVTRKAESGKNILAKERTIAICTPC
jgi:hypothetical protein